LCLTYLSVCSCVSERTAASTETRPTNNVYLVLTIVVSTLLVGCVVATVVLVLKCRKVPIPGVGRIVTAHNDRLRGGKNF